MTCYQICDLRRLTYSFVSEVNPVNAPLAMDVIRLKHIDLTEKQLSLYKQVVSICLQLLIICCPLKIPIGLLFLRLMSRYRQTPLFELHVFVI